MNGQRCGKGIYKSKNYTQYTGEWKEDKFHGVGLLRFPDGSFYNGDWHEGLKCGVGIY